MPKRCILGCSPSGVSTHHFPHPIRSPETFRAWVYIIGRNLDNTSITDIRKYVVCDIHFTKNDRNRNNRLNCLAVPSLFLPNDAQERKKSIHTKVSKLSKAKVCNDHDYAQPGLGPKDSSDNNQECESMQESFTPTDDADDENITDIDHQETENVKVNQKLFSWQKSESLPVPADDQENFVESDDQDRFFDDIPKVPQSKLIGTEQTVPEDNVFHSYQCNNCKGNINGFLYTCMECFDYDLCSACEARGCHALHYVLRIPQSRHHNEIQSTIETVRRELGVYFSKRRLNDDTDSMKLEIKEEVDPIHTEEVCARDLAVSEEYITIDEDWLDITEERDDDVFKSGETMAETEDDDDMVVEALEDDEETLSATLATVDEDCEDSDDSDEDVHRTTAPLTRNANPMKRTSTTTNQITSRPETFKESSDVNTFIPKGKITMLCNRNPKTSKVHGKLPHAPSILRRVLRTKEMPPQADRALSTGDGAPSQADGARKKVYITVAPLRKGVPLKCKIKR